MTTPRYLCVRRYAVNVAFDVLCLVLLLVLLATCDGVGLFSLPPAQLTSSIQCTAHSSTPITLAMYYSSEKQQWIEDVVQDFNLRGISACDGPIHIHAIPMDEGESMQWMLNGAIRPDIWSPSEGFWLTLLNAIWREKYSRDIVDTHGTGTPSLVFSPMVIAMWKSEAEALGWPEKAIGWADITALSVNPQGWAAYGHPEWGDFKFGHTNPGYSNSGLDAVIAEYYAAVGKVRGLTNADVSSQKTQGFVANVESSIIHYGESTGTFADEMFNKGPAYLSAAVMYESNVVEANQGRNYTHLAYPVVAIYPKEGTFLGDNPFAILQASWVTPAKKAAALVFRDFLLAPTQQERALQYGFRPARPKLAVDAPIDNAHGVDPTQPETLLQVPSANVVNAVESSWDQLRRQVDVMLIFDRSGGMNKMVGGISKIDAAKQGLAEFVNLLGDHDGSGLTVFNDHANILTPVSPLGPKRQEMLNLINGITASGTTIRLFDTIAEQVKVLQTLPSKHIKAVVVLANGIDTTSQSSLDQLIKEITPSGKDAGEGIKVFTIAYGSDADVNGLTKIAEATGGLEYAATPQNIQQVYAQIGQLL